MAISGYREPDVVGLLLFGHTHVIMDMTGIQSALLVATKMQATGAQELETNTHTERHDHQHRDAVADCRCAACRLGK